MLANQAQAIPLQITAAGFFPVDLTMLGFIIGSITSYFIVILQFIQATNSTRALENGEHWKNCLDKSNNQYLWIFVKIL